MIGWRVNVLLIGGWIAMRSLPLKPQAVQVRDDTFLPASLPLRHLRLTSGFGWRIHPVTGCYRFHAGVDLAAHHDSVFSILAGTVSAVGFHRLIGNYIIIYHGNGIESLYGHLSVIAVLPGERVVTGQPVGITGASGRVTGEHLHFAVKYSRTDVPPLALLAGLLAMPP